MGDVDVDVGEIYISAPISLYLCIYILFLWKLSSYVCMYCPLFCLCISINPFSLSISLENPQKIPE